MTSSEVIPANLLLFDELCSVLEQLFKLKETKSSKQNKFKNQKGEQSRILITFFNDFKIKLAGIQGKKNSTMLPILRLLLPDCERERSPYNLKESKLGKVLVKVLAIKQAEVAQKLLNYRSGHSHSNENDFAAVAYFAIRNIIGNRSGNFTIGQINEILDKIAVAESGSKQSSLDMAFSHALKNLSSLQLKWFFRIILKDLKLGMGTNRILSAFHPDAPEFYQNCSSLSKVCEELEEGETRPLELGIKLFFAISPMLSERLEVSQASQQLSFDHKKYLVENKFDGERFQIHMENGTFEYFSRKGHVYSNNYGKTYDSGLLTRYLKDCFNAEVSSFILDGEMMGWHKRNQHYSSKGIAFDVKKITEKSQFRPCFCAFDVLYYNGNTLVGPSEKGGRPLKDRLRILDSMFTDITGVIQHSKREIVKDSSDLLEKLNKAIENQDEGIVVKDIESFYIASKRNAGWYKIKPEYTESTMTDLDLVIIGADEAESKKQGKARCFHIACVDKGESDNADETRWLSVGRVATGLTYDERERICALLEKHWVSSRTCGPPPQLFFNKEMPDFWLMPQQSVVLQVRATELIRSTNYGTSYTLRFPRIIRVREDKPVDDIMTHSEFDALIPNKDAVIKLSKKRINEENMTESNAKVRRKRPTKVIQVAEQFRTTVTEPVEVISKALLGRKICLLSSDDDCTKEELSKILLSHSGIIVPNVGDDTWCAVVGRFSVRAKEIIKSQTVDVVSTTWLRNLPPSEELCTLPLHTRHLLAMTKATRLRLSRQYDTFGDSYTFPIDVNTLKECFDRMAEYEPEIYLTKEEMLNLDSELFGECNPYSFLRPCNIHVSSNSSIHTIQAKMYGAVICDVFAPNLTHVIVNKIYDTQNVECLKKIAKAHIVSEEWLEQCIKLKKIVPENNFCL